MFSFFAGSKIFSQELDLKMFVDKPDASKYVFVNIEQTDWYISNLHVKKFLNGTFIKQARNSYEWHEATDNQEAAWCY